MEFEIKVLGFVVKLDVCCKIEDIWDIVEYCF